jgi:hypothetical protein
MRRKLWLSRIIPFVLLGTLLDHWEMIRFVFTSWDDTKLGFGLSLAWLVLLLASVIGIRAGRRWGALSLIVLMPVSTIMLSVSLVPFLTSIVPAAARPYVMMALNLLMLIAAIVLATPPVRRAVPEPA